MPWREWSVVDERMKLVVAHASGLLTVTELAARFGISRKTAYKWIELVRVEGPAGLADHSRRPRHSPTTTGASVVEAILGCRRKHPRWGPKKLGVVLHRRMPKTLWPAVSTMARILKRHGLADGRRRRGPSVPIARAPYVDPVEPNLVWTTDYKGEFRTGDAQLCYPLTIMDRCSRYLLGCDGVAAPTSRATQAVFERVFRQYGLPVWVHSDNGTPFGSPGLSRLSRLQVWWLRLGILPEPIRPSHPDENAEHERMHRTLKAETARPPRATGAAQQRCFDRFRHEYNWERPHEALDMQVPGDRYRPSSRSYPSRLPELEYPGYFEVRRVSVAGHISWQAQELFLTEVLAHELVGVEEIDDGVWDVHFGPVILGRFDARTRALVGTRHLRVAPLDGGTAGR